MKSRVVTGLVATLVLGVAAPMAGASTASAAGFTCNEYSQKMKTVDGTPLRNSFSEGAALRGFLNAGSTVVTSKKCTNSKGNVWYFVDHVGSSKTGWAYSGHLRRV